LLLVNIDHKAWICVAAFPAKLGSIMRIMRREGADAAREICHGSHPAKADVQSNGIPCQGTGRTISGLLRDNTFFSQGDILQCPAVPDLGRKPDHWLMRKRNRTLDGLEPLRCGPVCGGEGESLMGAAA
jgi:hypothetical protein